MHYPFNTLTKQSKAIAVLLDPDKIDYKGLPNFISKIKQSRIDFLFVGGSLVNGNSIHQLISAIKELCEIPVLIFPGSAMQLSNKADALLFLSLISGRNAEYLIGQQVIAAPYIKSAEINTIATGYILVDCGTETTASYISNTKPIPYNKPQIAATTALAGEMLGHKVVYLDGGSGAAKPISSETIAAVRNEINIPIIVGGGIRSKKSIIDAFNAGANIVVVGTVIEESEDFLNDIAEIKK